MAPALVYLIGSALMALFILDYEMGLRYLARRFWPRRPPFWTRLPLAALCAAPMVGWLFNAVGQGLYYALAFFIAILLPAEIVYTISRRRYAKRQLRRYVAAAPTTRIEG